MFKKCYNKIIFLFIIFLKIYEVINIKNNNETVGQIDRDRVYKFELLKSHPNVIGIVNFNFSFVFL